MSNERFEVCQKIFWEERDCAYMVISQPIERLADLAHLEGFQ